MEKKFSREWKLEKGEWLQKHADGEIYRHWIQYGCEYSQKSGDGWGSIREAGKRAGLAY